ncbi:MAG TPA: acyl-CoA dehydrogenase family protein, partial [Herpetosiphonaceae bacterium]
AMLGRKELGISYFLQHIAVERLSGGIWAVAVAEHCLEEAQRYAAERVIGEETLWERSAVRHRIAQAVVQVTLLRSLVEQALVATDETRLVDPFSSAVIKAAVAPAMESVIGTCLQLQGARGLEADSPLLRLLNEFRVFGVAGGSTETMLDVVGELWATRAMQAADAELEARSVGA